MEDGGAPAEGGHGGGQPRQLTSVSPHAIDGAVRSAISQAIVRIHAEHYGKGATQAKTYVWDNLIVTVLRDVLTVAERTLVDVDSPDTVRDVRTKFQYAFEHDFTTAVERLTGRRVHSFMSQVDPRKGLGVEVFVLEAEQVEATGDDDEDDGPAAA